MKSWRDFGIIIPTTGHGAEVQTTCPQCSPHRRKKKAKCLSVNLDKEVWVCHHCDWRGSLKAGVEDHSNPFKWTRKTYTKPEPVKSTTLPENALAWFASRGITENVLHRNRIGYGPVYMPQVEEEVNAIQFPFYRGEELVNIKYRDGRKNFRQVSGAEKILYGLNDVDEMTIIVEGEMDKLALEVAGFPNCVSVPDGAPAANTQDYSSKFDYLENCKDHLDQVKAFILAVDSDEPGRKLEEELARRLGRAKCHRVQWPDGCKDANEVLVKHGIEALQVAIYDAKPYPVMGIFEVLDFPDKVLQMYEEGLKPGEKTGWSSLDEHYRVRPGEWTLVTGIPGHGKSEFIDALMVNLAKTAGWNFGIFSPENQPLERHVAKLAVKYSEKPFLKGMRDSMSHEDLQAAMLWINKHFSFILPDEDNLSLSNILELAQVLVFRKGIKGLVLDPWNEIEHHRPNNLTETEYISQSLAKIRRFARTNDVHVWLVAHPTKLNKDAKTGRYPVPTPYDVSGSANWRNKADNCLAVWRDVGPDSSLVDVHIQKIRFRENGQEGCVQFLWDKTTGVYHNKMFSFSKEVSV